MAKSLNLNDLTRRERQVMNIIYKLEKATAVDVVEHLPDRPNNATVRTILGVLEKKGFLQHDTVKGRFFYSATLPATRVRKGMLKQVVDTFFDGAEGRAVISILKSTDATLSDQERDEILELIEKSRQQGK